MTIPATIFEDLQNLNGFKTFIQMIYDDTLLGTNLQAEYDTWRQEWAFNFYNDDLQKLIPQVNGPPCHLKRAAFLTFWLRREPPVAVLNEVSDYEDLDEKMQYKTDFILQYGREWFALRAGYELALFGQKQKLPGHVSITNQYTLSEKFIDDTVEFLKRKSVSPHALYLIFLGIFDHKVDRLGTN